MGSFLGLHAAKPFADREPILIYAGEILDYKESKRRISQHKKKEFATNYQVMFTNVKNKNGEDFFVDCSEKGNEAGMANSLTGRDNARFGEVNFADIP